MGTLDVKLVSLIWRILQYHAVKIDSVVKFFFQRLGPMGHAVKLPIVNKSFKSDPTKVVIGTVDLFYD
jgi:hypothetical protein